MGSRPSNRLNLDEVRVEMSTPLQSKLANHRAARANQRTKPTQRFLRGDIDMAWLAAADEAGALMVSLLVRHLHRMWKVRNPDNPHTFPVSGVQARRWVSDRRRRRGLQRLAAIGLIRLDERIGKSPLVTILELPFSE
jgi:hypothetical protein